MKRAEKIRLIKGLIRGSIEPDELLAPEVEVWFQLIGSNLYKHSTSGETATVYDLQKRERISRKIIRVDFVSGKTIL